MMLVASASTCQPPPTSGGGTPTTVVSAPPIEVTASGDAGDGVCDVTCTLREAIAAAEAAPGPNAIELPSGTFVVGTTAPLARVHGRSAARRQAPSGVGPDGEAFRVTQELTISGTGAATTTIDFSGDAFRVGWLISANLTLESLTVTDLSTGSYPQERTVVEGAFAASGGMARFKDSAFRNVAPDSQVTDHAAGSLVDVGRTNLSQPFGVEIVDSTVANFGRFEVEELPGVDGMYATLVRNAGGTLLVDGLDLSDASPILLGRCATSLAAPGATSTDQMLCPSSAVIWNSRLKGTAGPAIRPTVVSDNVTFSSYCQRKATIGAADARVVIGFTLIEPSPSPASCGTLPDFGRTQDSGDAAAVVATGTIDMVVSDSQITATPTGRVSGAVVVDATGESPSAIALTRSTLSGGLVGLYLPASAMVANVFASTLSGDFAGMLWSPATSGQLSWSTLSGSKSFASYYAPPLSGTPLSIETSILDGACDPAPSGMPVSGGNNVISSCPDWASASGDVVGVDPRLGPLADNGGTTLTRLPAADSPALDTHLCSVADERNAARPSGAACDSGAVERGAIPQGYSGPPPYPTAPDAPAVIPIAPPTTTTSTSTTTTAPGATTTSTTMAPPPGPVVRATQVASGEYHSCALLESGTVRCWGRNIFGELGQLGVQASSVPMDVSDVAGVVSLAVGDSNSCALLLGGTVRCWGLNAGGQLGHGTQEESSPATDVVGVSDATAVASFHDGFCAIVGGGTVRCWGNNGGALGDGISNRSSVPVTVLGVVGATRLAGGVVSMCAVVAGGLVRCWGDNSFGQLGNGSTSQTPVTATDVVGLTGVTDIAGGALHYCAVASGESWCWGRMEFDGVSLVLNSAVPEVTPGLNGVVAVGAGLHTCVIVTNGDAKCWGYNASGSLGNGTLESPSSSPQSVLGLSDAVSLSLSRFHSCAVLQNGGVRCWGSNVDGKLGDGTDTPRTVPTQVLEFP